MKIKIHIVFIAFIFCGYSLHAQVVKSVVLDSIMIESVKRGFNVEDFIMMVQEDTSFLKGFRTLRNSPHNIQSEIIVYDKKKKNVKSSRIRKGVQNTNNAQRWIHIEDEKTTGKFYDKKRIPRMYTAELFDELFYYTDTLELIEINHESDYNFKQTNRSNIGKLKQLVFNPGTDIKGVPVVGKRMAIFSDEMTPYYNYNISSKMFNDSISCYVFSCRVKNNAGSYPVLQYMNTWFDKRTFNIIYRDYYYTYSGLLFTFDVSIKIFMKFEKEKLYPGIIEYSGFWDVPFKKQETVDFEVMFRLIDQIEIKP